MFRAAANVLLAAFLAAADGAVVVAGDIRPTRAEPKPVVVVEDGQHHVVSLADLTEMAIRRNPALAQAAFRIDAASGRALQAGLYPNPVLSISGDELGDVQSSAGIWAAPQIAQEIVTGGKRRLATIAACKEVDRAAFELAAKKYKLLGEIRRAYVDVQYLRSRIFLLDELIGLAEQTRNRAQALLGAKLIARMDAIRVQVELDRLVSERDAAQAEKPAALKRLAAVVGDPKLALAHLDGSLEIALPRYELSIATHSLANHPDVHAARVGADRARVLVDRARAQKKPNVTVSASYQRQNQNRSDDWGIGVAIPIPSFDRNQGNIRAAIAELGEAASEIDRVANELQNQLAASYQEYAGAKRKLERYRTDVVPHSKETYHIAVQAYNAGQIDIDKLLAQTNYADARIEELQALGIAWRAAAALSALMCEEVWPAPSSP